MVALLVSELQEDPLALRLFEAIAVPLEELVRPTFTLDPHQQRLAIVHAVAQRFGARRKQAVGRTLEEQKRRMRLKLGIGGPEKSTFD